MRKTVIIALFIFLPLLAYGGNCKQAFESFLPNKPTLELLSSALQSSGSLQKHLNSYNINEKSLETGETLLHLALKNFKQDYISFIQKVLESEGITQANYKRDMLVILDKNSILEELLRLSADPLISNDFKYRVVDSYYFTRFLKKNLELKDKNQLSFYNELVNKYYKQKYGTIF